jgi:hypothetical protein
VVHRLLIAGVDLERSGNPHIFDEKKYEEQVLEEALSSSPSKLFISNSVSLGYLSSISSIAEHCNERKMADLTIKFALESLLLCRFLCNSNNNNNNNNDICSNDAFNSCCHRQALLCVGVITDIQKKYIQVCIPGIGVSERVQVETLTKEWVYSENDKSLTIKIMMKKNGVIVMPKRRNKVNNMINNNRNKRSGNDDGNDWDDDNDLGYAKEKPPPMLQENLLTLVTIKKDLSKPQRIVESRRESSPSSRISAFFSFAAFLRPRMGVDETTGCSCLVSDFSQFAFPTFLPNYISGTGDVNIGGYVNSDGAKEDANGGGGDGDIGSTFLDNKFSQFSSAHKYTITTSPFIPSFPVSGDDKVDLRRISLFERVLVAVIPKVVVNSVNQKELPSIMIRIVAFLEEGLVGKDQRVDFIVEQIPTEEWQNMRKKERNS